MGPPAFEGPGFPGTGQVKMSPRSWQEQTDQTLVMKPRKVPRTSVLCLEAEDLGCSSFCQSFVTLRGSLTLLGPQHPPTCHL